MTTLAQKIKAIKAKNRRAARAWSRLNGKKIPRILSAKLEPTQRGHRGHTAGVMDPDLTLAGLGFDPLVWLESVQAVAARAAHLSAVDTILLQKVDAALALPAGRAPGWCGKEPAERTVERRRALARSAVAGGQIEFVGAGWQS